MRSRSSSSALKALRAATSQVRSIEVDESRWPLLVATFRGIATSQDVEAFVKAQARAVQLARKHVLIVDTLEGMGVPALPFGQLCDWHDQHFAGLAHARIGTVFATLSPLMRGAIVRWARRLPQEPMLVATRTDAEAWALQRLNLAGVPHTLAPIRPSGTGKR